MSGQKSNLIISTTTMREMGIWWDGLWVGGARKMVGGVKWVWGERASPAQCTHHGGLSGSGWGVALFEEEMV